MSSEQWVCKNCGQVGGFRCLGRGFIVCEGCGSRHFVMDDGSILLAEKKSPVGNLAEALADFSEISIMKILRGRRG